MESCIAEALVDLKGLPFCSQSYPGLWEWTKDICKQAFGGRSVKKQVSTDAKMDVDLPTSLPIPTVAGQSHDQQPQSHDKQQAYFSLIQLCLYGTAICAVRYPVFFKPLYRMAATLHAIGLPTVWTPSPSLSPSPSPPSFPSLSPLFPSHSLPPSLSFPLPPSFPSSSFSPCVHAACQRAVTGSTTLCSHQVPGEAPATVCSQVQHLYGTAYTTGPLYHYWGIKLCSCLFLIMQGGGGGGGRR